MASHRASVDWSLGETAGEDFLKGRYGRGHAVAFEHGPQLRGTASPHVVGNRWAEAGAADPEQMLVAALSTCHMLSFLHVAREAGFVVARYHDAAEGVMEKTAQGRLAVTRVALRPTIEYQGRAPSSTEAGKLHHAAHETCFIANSVRTEVVVEAPAEA
ncbi:MAG: putative redox protein regulator of disulfide bond formation [Phenylobacterium sp.]|nr:putative redox protein regulator of disulfide bond formation [Phenylobacterium sp.]